MPDAHEDKIAAAIRNPRNMGEMADADTVGTVGSPDCGDMVRMWLKFKEEGGKKIIDRASFQSKKRFDAVCWLKVFETLIDLALGSRLGGN